MRALDPTIYRVGRIRRQVFDEPDISMIEVAFRAYELYRRRPIPYPHRRAGPYSFILLLRNYTRREELIPYLEQALEEIIVAADRGELPLRSREVI